MTKGTINRSKFSFLRLVSANNFSTNLEIKLVFKKNPGIEANAYKQADPDCVNRSELIIFYI